MRDLLLRLVLVAFGLACVDAAEVSDTNGDVVLFEDGFAALRTGSLGSDVGAHAEYHYLPEVGPKGN